MEELDGFVGRGELEVFEIIKQTFLDMALGKNINIPSSTTYVCMNI